MPAPFLIARSMVSLVTDDFLAFSTATNKRALRSGSAPPSLAATMISRTSLTTIWPFLCALASRPACFHCAPIRFSTVWKICAVKKTKLFLPQQHEIDAAVLILENREWRCRRNPNYAINNRHRNFGIAGCYFLYRRKLARQT